jgi:hypothetical protein
MKTCGLTSVPSFGASDRKAIKSRVFNGDIARLGDFPWMTSAYCLTQLALSAFRIF